MRSPVGIRTPVVATQSVVALHRPFARATLVTALTLMLTVPTLLSSAPTTEMTPHTEIPGPATEEFQPYACVMVCGFASGSRPWSISWHPEPPGTDPTMAMRVFKQLSDDDVTECLALLIESDPRTLRAASSLATAKDVAAKVAATETVYERWNAFGVDKAIREVADTGHRGQAVTHLLRACTDLRSKQGTQRRTHP